jgi:branched-chain amino acid transport system substrate-binding protein
MEIFDAAEEPQGRSAKFIKHKEGKMWNKALIFSFLAVFIFAVSASAQSTIKIGFGGPLSGPQTEIGKKALSGVQLAVAEANAKGGILGKKLEVIPADDEGKSEGAVNAANSLIKKEVVGVVGHWNSACSFPASEVYAEKNIAMITYASTNPKLTERGLKNIFRTYGRDDEHGRINGEFIVNTLKKKRAAILHDKGAYGKMMAEITGQTVKKLGGEVVIFDGITSGEKDFRAILTKIKSLNPEVLFYGGYYSDFGLILKQARELGAKWNFVSVGGTYDPELIKIAGEGAEGAFIQAISLDAVKDQPSFKRFLQAFKDKYKTDPDLWAAIAYENADILISGIKKAGGTDSKKIIDAIKSFKDYQGTLGPVTFNEKGDIMAPLLSMFQVQHGKFVPYISGLK